MRKLISQLKKGQKVALWATLITLILAVSKGLIGYFFGVSVLIADAFHSGADTIAILASAFGLWLASTKKTQRFPYGLFKAETFAVLLIGGFICWSGVELMQEGYKKLFIILKMIDFPLLPLIISIVSIITSYFIAVKEKNVGIEINSPSLIANASESFLDIISSIVVLAGILMAYWNIPYVEGIIIMIIALLLIKLGLENLWNSFFVLLDANLDKELQSNIQKIVINIPGVELVSNVKIRQAGPFRMVELKFMTNPSISIYNAHFIANEIEDLIQEKFTNIESVFVHPEPLRNDELKAIVPVSEINGMDSLIYSHFGRAPYFAVIRIKSNDFAIEDFYLNEFLNRKIHIGLNVVKVIIQYDLDMIFTSKIGEIAFYKLKDNYIDIYKVEKENLTIRQCLELYRNNALPRITSPTHSIDESITKSE